jgi:hypothetical protein
MGATFLLYWILASLDKRTGSGKHKIMIFYIAAHQNFKEKFKTLFLLKEFVLQSRKTYTGFLPFQSSGRM